MFEILVVVGVFWGAYFVGYMLGKNAGYQEGWRAKECGEQYKSPFK